MTIGGGEAADQMVRMMLSGTEVAVRLGGSALKNLLALTMALAHNRKTLTGKVNMGKMLRETRDLRRFPMTPQQYKQFKKLAKKHKLLYSVICDKDDRGKLMDVILPVTELDRASLRWVREVLTPSGNKERKIRLPSEPENMEFKIHTDRSLLAQFLYQTYSEHLESQGMFSAKHCGESHQDYTGKVLILRPSVLADNCRDVKNQLWYGQSGFGLSPTSSGRAVFATCLGNGEKARWNRLDFMGVLDEQYLPDWAAERLTELRAPAQQQEEPVQEQDSGPAQGGMEMR